MQYESHRVQLHSGTLDSYHVIYEEGPLAVEQAVALVRLLNKMEKMTDAQDQQHRR